jgi:hypothetical protein
VVKRATRGGPLGRASALLVLALGLLGACAAAPPRAGSGARVTAEPEASSSSSAPWAGPGEAPAPLATGGMSSSAGVAADPVAPACAARPGGDRLRRSAVVKTVDAGLGRWLQSVSLDPKVEGGRFRGWIVRSLPSGDPCYADVDLRADDVVVRINGRSIERPDEAHRVWTSLRTSPALVIDFLRDGQAHTLRFAIVDP